MHLYELQGGAFGPQVDKQLQGVASGINQTNNQPQAPMQAPPQADLKSEEDSDPKKVDSYLLAAVKSMPYVTEYDFNEDNNIAPYNLLQRDIGDLSKIRNLIRAKMSIKTMSDQVGLYDSPDMTFFVNMLNFIERVIELKKKMDQGSPRDTARQEKPKNPAPKSNVR